MKTNFFYLAVAIATTSLFCYSESQELKRLLLKKMFR